jgi:hypothetical protein
MRDSSGKLDVLIRKVTSRKLLVFVIGTIGMFAGLIDPDNWTSLGLAYIGMESLVDIAALYKHGKITKKEKEVKKDLIDR